MVSVYFVFIESGYGKGPMNGGGCIRQVVKDTTAYSPNAVNRNTKQLMNYLAIMQNFMEKYDEGDIGEVKKSLTHA